MQVDETAAPAGFMPSAPMALDRTEGWRYVRAPGEVYERDGAWYLTSLEAVRFAHQHPEIFSSAEAFASLGSPVPLIPIAVDRPDHVRYRRILDPLFAPRVVNRLDDELRRQVRDIIAGFAGRGACDVVADLAELYPTQVILTLFGMPLEDRDTFIRWTHHIIDSSGFSDGREMTEEQMNAGLALFTYLQEYIVTKRATPGDDVLSTILGLTGDDEWTDEEVLGLCFLFVLAGLDTVTAAIGFVLRVLAERPDLRAAIRADAAAAGPIIEEVLRLELPAPMTPRVTRADTVVCGTPIPAGSYVFLVLATANRDERELGDEIDLANADRGHLSFGGGIHRCLGSHLARRELRLVVEEFIAAIPEFELAGHSPPRVHWPSGTLHYETLPIRFPVGSPV
jgi:cytochrome P450